ncbi:MAG: hypothetical protein M3R17_02145 [Bacteroidota bacterium]|nr:hypothetical protein [Bacteroidota bacterium]
MKKYKVNIDRQKPSSEEILAGRNFDELMKQYKAAPTVIKKSLWKSGWFFGAIAAVIAVVSVIFVFTDNNETDKPLSQQPQIIQQPVIDPQDSALTNNQTPSNSFTSSKRKIAPPLPGLTVRNLAYKFKSALGSTFTHTSGTKVTFPANAFADANGNPVNGNVEIQYREFRDQVDFFLSGIPMQYDSSQHTYQFVSAGMMEISGFINGQPVFLAKGKTVNVEFASKNPSTQFNLYRFDTLAGNWNYLGKDRVVLTPEQKMDSASLVTQALKTNGKMCGFINEMQKPLEPLKPLKADKRKNRFTIAINPLEFPEMKEYKDMVFEVDESNQRFDRAWYKVTWESIKLSKTVENKYKIALAKEGKVVMLDVYPVYNDKNFETEMAAYNVRFTEYKKQLDQYNQLQEQKKARANGIFDNGNGTIVKAVDGGFMYYTKPDPKDEKKAEEIMRCFTISGFGVYNMDAVEELPVGGIVTLTMNGDDGKLFSDFATIYHVDRNKNSLFNYHNENPVTEFHFNPKSSNLIWAVKDGKLFYADNEQFAKQPKSGKGSIVLKAVGKEFKTAEEMKRFFRISPGA